MTGPAVGSLGWGEALNVDLTRIDAAATAAGVAAAAALEAAEAAPTAGTILAGDQYDLDDVTTSGFYVVLPLADGIGGATVPAHTPVGGTGMTLLVMGGHTSVGGDYPAGVMQLGFFTGDTEPPAVLIRGYDVSNSAWTPWGQLMLNP